MRSLRAFGAAPLTVFPLALLLTAYRDIGVACVAGSGPRARSCTTSAPLFPMLASRRSLMRRGLRGVGRGQSMACEA